MTFRKCIYAALLLIWCTAASAAETGTIKVSDLRVRTGPGTEYRISASLPMGAKVNILSRQEGWLEIEHNDIRGFILQRDDFITIAHDRDDIARQPSRPLKNAPQNAETIKGKLRQAESELAATRRKEREVLEQFNAADQALSHTRRQVRTAKTGLTEVQEKIEEVNERSSALEKDILEGEKYAAKRLVALYKANWVGKIHLLATADSFFDFVSRKETLERILAQDETFLEELNRNKTALESLLTQLNTRKAEKRALELKLRERAAKLDAQQQKRKKLLKTIRGKKSLELAALKALREAALELDAAIVRIEPATPPIDAAVGSKRQNKPFKAHKGLLSWPVKGKIISFFGPHQNKKFAVTNFQSGINIQAERGEPIRSVSDGHVIFANWFKGFGNMMILDHGDHYYTVYAHLEEVFKVKGDRVDQGEVIATVGDSGSMKGPALHFEVRHHGKPIDPLKWIHKG
ncbi:MAG: peptidoglycan DD-metalloendopeptidase family protein [Desulfobacteraceae bacterium]